VITVSGEDIPKASILIRNGKIAEIGASIAAPPGVKTISLKNRVVMPGIIDPHSHMALDSTNEFSASVTPEVRCEDVMVHDDDALFRALAGGCTTIHFMHGSANTIGGQCAIMKLKYGRSGDEMLLHDRVRTVKWALGENVIRGGKRGNRRDPAGPLRFPGTRMGVEATLRRALAAGQDYAAKRAEDEAARAAGKDPAPLRRDLRLEALADMLAGRIWVNTHCYRADEILRLMKVAEDFGIRIAVLHHVLEGYRIMPEIMRHGAGTATFADWWAYKVEAYEAVPHNAGMMLRAGINSAIKSDSGDHVFAVSDDADRG
jgi:imidazolonepropionase-like amidohydrolase